MHQRIQARVGGTAAAREKRRAGQRAATRKVNDRARMSIDALGLQRHAAQHKAVAADALVESVHAVVNVGQAVLGAAIGHGQPGTAGRRDAALAQHHRGRYVGTRSNAAQDEAAQRRAQHTALVDVGRHQLQAAEGGERHARVGVADALHAQAACRVVQLLVKTALVPFPPPAGADLSQRTSGRVDLAGRQHEVACGFERGAIAHGRLEQAHVALAAQLDVLEAEAVHLDPALGRRQGTCSAKGHGLDHVEQRGLHAQSRIRQQFGHAGIERNRHGVAVSAQAGAARQAHVRRGQRNPRALRRAVR
ncbi:hypothetical protein D3C87_1175140 [compost metagenome]